MANILIKAACLICMIAAGYLFKKSHLLSPDDFKPISKIVFNLTLPCAIVNSLSNSVINCSYLLIILIGLACNLITLAAGYMLKRRKTGQEKAFAMINLSGYNIGNFAYPFIQTFLGPNAIMALCLFDAGNCIMCTSGTKVVTGNMVSRKRSTNLPALFARIFYSAPFDTYIVMFLLTLAKLRLPQPVLAFTGIIGNANTFLSMFMLGVGFELYFRKEYRNTLAYYIGIRMLISAAMAACFFYLLPFDYEIRKALIILVFAPVSTWCPVYTQLAGGDVAVSSAVTSFSILVGMMTMTLLLFVL